jgi:hypothetical protein
MRNKLSGVPSTGRESASMVEPARRIALTLRIDEQLRRNLLQWTIEHHRPHSVLVRKLLQEYFAGRVKVAL